MGSAGSAKSYSITQKLIIRACREQIKILVCRRYATTIRNTVFALFKEILKKWKIVQYVKINESDYRIIFPNSSEILFVGLDDETKLLSLTNISTVWVEEAYECSQSIVEQLNLRMRGTARNQQIIMSWNPISQSHWLYTFTQTPPDSYVFIHSTYKDNPYLSQEYINALEELRVRNPQKARIYCDGEWGVDADGLVLRNWKIQEFDPTKLLQDNPKLEHRVGMDFGYIDPSAIVDTLYDRDNKIIYIMQEYYKSGQTLDTLYSHIKEMGLHKAKIQCDSAEPRTIDYFRRQGVNAVACIKGQNSVSARITFLQNQQIIVLPKCISVIEELNNYSYIIDKKTGKYTDDTTHEYSHSIDALGYAYSDIYAKGGVKTMPKSILGL